MNETNQVSQVAQNVAGSRPTLGAMTVADLLDVTFELIKGNWRPVILLSLVLAIPLAFATFLLNFAFDAEAGVVTGSVLDALFAGSLEAGIVGGFVSLTVSVVAVPLIAGAITRVVAGSYLGREFNAMSALKSMLPYWLPLMAAVFLARLALIPGLFAIGIGIAVMQALFWVVVPVIAVEEVGPIAAVKRSWKLMTARFFPYVCAVLVVGIVAQILSWVVSYPASIASVVWMDNVVLSSALQGLSIVTSSLVTTPFTAVIATLVYFDARVRVEGFDVQMMAAGLSKSAPPQGPVSP